VSAFRKSVSSLRATRCSVALAAACVALWLPGCAWSEKIKVAGDGSPEYQNLQINYDLASTPDLQRLDQPAPIVQTSSVDSKTDSATAAPTTRPWTKRRVHLELQYPYPGVHSAFARATLRIVSDVKISKPVQPPAVVEWKDAFSGTPVTYSQHSPSGMSAPQPMTKPEPIAPPANLPPEEQEELAATEEVLYIDLPKTEIDALLRELAKEDFFKAPSNPDGQSHVLVVVNKGRCEKGWSRDEQLDRLVELLRRHGAPLPATALEAKKS
jgi:hypothetical protein